MNLSEELDRAIGDGPPLPPPTDLLPEGRRALARRRAALGAAGGVAAVALAASVLAGGGPARQETVAPADTAPTRAAQPTESPGDQAGPEQTGPEVDTSEPLVGVPDKGLVRFAQGSRLEPAEGVEIVRQVAHPDLPASWAGPRDPSAAAEVLVDGTRWFVLVRNTDGRPQDISVPAGADGPATFEQFLEVARQQYEDEVGLL